MNGFTAIRDLEPEGAMYADVDVKTAIEHGDGLTDDLLDRMVARP